jgi:hydroxyquinol 1,2-dioxygenase
MASSDNEYLNETNSANVVNARNSDDADPRLRDAMTVIVTKLHEAVREIEPTQKEWMTAIQFLTEADHMCDAWRQEFILLSDTLGVSMLVDAINNRKPSGASESTVLGPFHLANAPELPMGANISQDGKGEDMVAAGRILDTDGAPIPDATIDIWQANDEGFYDVQQKGIQPDFNLRGVFKTETDGAYWFRAIKPKPYPVPEDGPVGRLMRALGRDVFRPAHLHYIITADGFQPLTTHIFDPDDPHIREDVVFGVKESLLAEFVLDGNAAKAQMLGFKTPFWSVNQDFVLARA